ncbi:hypothetical protein JOQ06_015505 [Pogonophryne albipinna]|uniref:Uncharacterized protein n=1 Tax=Pogonophryne albipinna TaxID=1090488 RepID=A0AAD6FBD7_9TELE|nr:hypothetical protein JOQ06_015505 [Pogonophryne albipinna]
MRAVFWRGSHRRQRCDSLLSLSTFLDVRDSELFISVCSALSRTLLLGGGVYRAAAARSFMDVCRKVPKSVSL